MNDEKNKFNALMHCGMYVDANRLEKGIYTCSRPFIYSLGDTIEMMIDNAKQMKDMTGANFISESYFENLVKCELVPIVITPTTDNPSVLPTDDEIEKYATEKYELYSESVRDVAFESGAKWIKSIAEPIIATHQSEIESLKQRCIELAGLIDDSERKRIDGNQRLKAELEEIRSAIDKALSPEYITCDGGYCMGCYKDILRPYKTNQSQKQKT